LLAPTPERFLAHLLESGWKRPQPLGRELP